MSDDEDRTFGEGRFARRLSTAFTEAAQASLDDWGGGMITGFVGYVEFIGADGSQGWALITGDGQRPTATIGMLRCATISAEGDVDAYLNGRTGQ